jgi:hypothetical protein
MTQRSARPCPGPDPLHPDPANPPLTAQPLCDDCQRAVRRAVEELPALYVELWQALQPGASGSSDRVTTTRTPPLPLDAAPLELMARIVAVTGSWAGALWPLLGLSDPPPMPVDARPGPTVREVTWSPIPGTDDPDFGPAMARAVVARPVAARQQLRDATTGWYLTTATRVLGAHLDRLLDLPATRVERRVTVQELALLPDEVVGSVMAGGAVVELWLDGAAAGCELLDLKHRARRMLGQTRGKERVSRATGLACPQCAAMSLVRWHGTEQVDCEACDGRWPKSQVDWLVRQLTEESRRGGRMGA